MEIKRLKEAEEETEGGGGREEEEERTGTIWYQASCSS